MRASCFTVGFSGHRAGFAPGTVRAALDRVLEDLQWRAAATGRALHLCTSLAEGCDTLCVQLARQRGIPRQLLLPLDELEFANDFSPAGWALAAAELAMARVQPGGAPVRVVAGGAIRPECYVALAVGMLQSVDVLVAVTDGAPSRGPGGTGSVIDMARELHLPVVLIDATTGAITSPPSLDRVFQSDTPRCEPDEGARPTTAPDAPQAAPNPRPFSS